VAEVAVTVADSHQGRGLGSLLLGVLALSATQNGIRTFRAYILAENQPIIEILHDLGAVTSRDDGGVVRVDLAIPKRPDDLPDTPAGRVFKAMAQQVLPPLQAQLSGFTQARGDPEAGPKRPSPTVSR
jgi:hypothetical protein